MIIGSLGDIPFETSSALVRTPHELTRKISSRFETHAVLGTKPRLEFLGEDLDSVTLQISLVEQGSLNPAEELQRLARICRSGDVVPLVLMGVNCGSFVVESVSESWRGKGTSGPFCIEVTLELKEYV